MRKSPNLILDTTANSCLARQGLKPKAIPDKNQYVYLRTFTSNKLGKITEDCSSLIHKENIQLAVSVCQKMGLSVCGIDLISEDISVPWYKNGGKVNEINFQPMIGTHSTSLSARHTFFKAILNNNGQIPIHIYLGSPQALEHSLIKKHNLLIEQSINAHLISDNENFNTKQNQQSMVHTSFVEKLVLCLENKTCEAVILAITSNEILGTGLPIDRVDSLEICSQSLDDKNNPGTKATGLEFYTICSELSHLANRKTIKEKII